MKATYGFSVGFPLVANGGFWGALVLITPALYIIGKYAGAWGWRWWLPTLLFSVIVSYAMYRFVYMHGALPDALSGYGTFPYREISAAGWANLLFFGFSLACILLFYFHTPTATFHDVVAVGILLALYIIAANHVPWYFFYQAHPVSWCTPILTTERTPWFIMIGSGLGLSFLTLIKLWWL